jgi:hypothetical protein
MDQCVVTKTPLRPASPDGDAVKEPVVVPLLLTPSV